MRYGTVPVVRNIGGLKDTVIDIAESGGYGICFEQATVWDIVNSIKRAVELFGDKKKMAGIISIMMKIDNSWEISAKKYIKLYNSLQ